MPEWIGKTVGKVRIEREIARGGMAEVYLGTHLTLDRPVAVKVMHNYVESDPDLQSRFEREAKVVAGLRHPNIVQIFDYDTAEGHPYIVMEYLVGPSLGVYLRELHKRGQRLEPMQVARLLITIAAALDYAHEQGVVHRDVKPGNIILHNKSRNVSVEQHLTARTEPVITDFGLVRIAQSTMQTASGSVSGTPAYMSPEQAQGLKVDHRSDIYSLGVVLYEMLAGRIPFEGDTSWTLIFKHINEPPPAVEGIPPAVQSVLDRALAKRPEERHQSARELAADYMEAIGLVSEANTLRISLPPSRPTRSITRSSPVKQTSTPAWTRIATFSILGLLFVAAALLVVPRLLGSNTPTQPPPATNTTTELHEENHGTDAAPTASNGVVPVDTGEPIGLLRFQDGTAPADKVTLSTSSMPLPPEGNQYEVWLLQDDGEQRISIGPIAFDAENKGSLSFVDSGGRNLIGTYSALEITVEPNDGNPNSSNNVAFSVRLPEGGLTHVRHLLFSFGATPNQTGFVRGLDADTRLLTDLSAQMLTALETGNEAEMLLQAERMMNLVVGNQSVPDYKDWNDNGAIDDPGDGYGLLQNGEQLGYIQGTFSHADLAITSPDATQNMLIHGGHVKACALNVSDWTAQLRTQLIAILENPASPEREALIRQAVAMANQIRTGVDVNGNENIEPIPGEGGAITAYEHSYYMADILLPPSASP
ncbi:MAG TPA: protein kinase [Anaerolineales bacterium]|nr:protein kinase [Anaerolineales bacterium]